MKKTLSFLLSIVMLISTFMPISALAATKVAAPAVAVGDTFSITAPPTDMDSSDGSNSYYAKFTPAEAGYYEFVFDTKYTTKITGKEDFALAIASSMLVDTSDDMVAYGMAMATAGEGAEDEEDIAYPSLCGELKAGKTYYLTIANFSSTSYTSNVTVNKHTHHFYNDKIESYVDTDSLKDNIDGAYYTACDKNGCVYMKINKTIKKVKTISLSATKYTYNGKEKKPTVTIKDSKGNKIDKKNYTVKYSNNKKVGTGKVKITFKNDYEGSFTKTFKINPKGTSISSLKAKKKGFTVKWKKQATQTTGYQVQYATDSKFTKNRKTLKVKGTKNLSKTVSKLKAKKKYYVRVRTYKTVGKTDYYSGWTKGKAITTKR